MYLFRNAFASLYGYMLMFQEDKVFTLENEENQLIWRQLENSLQEARSHHIAVTVTEDFVCSFKCRHKVDKCEDVDYRNETWEAQLGQIAKRPCPDDIPGFAKWECGEDGAFIGRQPDRGDCVSPWINDIEDEVCSLFYV